MLKPNQKIIFLRKTHSISQKELAKNTVSTSTLCSLEKGKFNLSKKNAELIARNFNEIFSSRGMKDRVDVAWLYEDIEVQTKKRIDSMILDIYSCDKDLELEVKGLLNEFPENSELIKLTFTYGYHCYLKKMYLKAKKYLEITVDNERKLDKKKYLGIAIKYLLEINEVLEIQEESLRLYINYFDIIEYRNEKLKAETIISFANTLMGIGEYEKALKLYMNPCLRKEEYEQERSLGIGGCLGYLKRYEKAIEVFNTLKLSSKKEIRERAYCSIIKFTEESDNYVLCKISIEKLESEIEEGPSFDESYYRLGKGYLYIGEKEMSIANLERSLEGKKVNNMRKLEARRYFDSIKNLLKLYNKKDKRKILKIRDRLLEIPLLRLEYSLVFFMIKRFDELLFRDETSSLIVKLYESSKEGRRYIGSLETK